MSRRKKPTNAFKHGVYAAVMIAPGEDPEEFEELHAELIQEWRPDGATEKETVLSLAIGHWRKRRVQKFRQAEMYRNLANPEHPSYNETGALLCCVGMLQGDPEVRFAEASRLLRADRVQYLEKKFPLGDFESAADRAQAIIEEIVTNLLPKLKIDPEIKKFVSLMEAAAALTGDSFEKEIALDERLDAMIDRLIKRLLTLKASKPMLGLMSTQQAAGQPKKLVEKKPQIKRVHFSDAA